MSTRVQGTSQRRACEGWQPPQGSPLSHCGAAVSMATAGREEYGYDGGGKYLCGGSRMGRRTTFFKKRHRIQAPSFRISDACFR